MNKKLIVITGASSGFGLEAAKLFSKDGYPVLMLARRLEKMEELNLKNTMCRKVDVSDYTSFSRAVYEAEKKYGKTDLMVNNAGVMLLGEICEQDPKEWQTMVNVNLIGVMNGMRIVLDDMKKRNSGTIINVSSIAGLKPVAEHAAYCATKFGVTALTDATRLETAHQNVRFTNLCPGAVTTELLGHTTNLKLIDDYKQWQESSGANRITALDVAKTIKHIYELPQHVSLREVVITDTKQG